MMLKTKRAALQEHESGIGIKLDYSDTYFENEILDSELEGRLAQIRRERYRVSVERAETLKQARKEAEDMQQLSEAIKKGAIVDSVTIFSKDKNGEEKDKSSELTAETSVTHICKDVKRLSTTRQESDTPINVKDNDAEPEQPQRTINTLTMFALSLQKFRTPLRTNQRAQTANDSSTSQETAQERPLHPQRRHARSAFARPSGPRAFSRLDKRPKSQRPVTVRQRRIKDGEVLEAADVMPVMVKEVSLHKRKQTRSRRELQELSKMEQKEHILKIDREAERKKKLLDWAKGESGLEQRVKLFVKSCEDFNKKRQCHESMYNSPRRSRTVMF